MKVVFMQSRGLYRKMTPAERDARDRDSQLENERQPKVKTSKPPKGAKRKVKR